MKKFVQITCLCLIPVCIFESALWAYWSELNVTLGILISICVGYAGLLSLVYFGDKETWAKRVLRRIWLVFFDSLGGVVSTGTFLACSAIVLGILAYHASLLLVTCKIVSPGEFEEQFEITVMPSGTVEPIKTDSHDFSFELPRSMIGEDIFLSAESKSFRSEHAHAVTVSRRANVVLEVKAKSSSAFGLKNLAFYVREGGPTGGRHPYEFELIDEGKSRSLKAIESPIGARDDIRLRGTLNQPAYWCLLWIDSHGVVTAEVDSTLEMTSLVDYPNRDEVAMVQPAGVHLILVVAGSKKPNMNATDLQSRLSDLGKLPDQLPRQWAITFRSPQTSTKVGEPIVLPDDYLSKVNDRIPTEFEVVYGVFLEVETEK